MLILHTSDWHLGRQLYKHSRAEDLNAVMEEIVHIAHSRKPDLILHTGDLFDHHHVSHDIVNDAVAVLKQLSAVAPVVVVAGNHDAPKRFSTYAQLIDDNPRLHFIYQPIGVDGDYLAFPTPQGGTLRLGALPFVSAHQFVDVFGDPAARSSDYAIRVADIQTSIGVSLTEGLDPAKDIAVFAAHLYINGSGLSHSERPGHVRDEYKVDASSIPHVNYAAFGHIHKPQKIDHQGVCARYAGSPIQLDFGETRDTKSVVLAEVIPGNETTIELVELTAGRRLRAFSCTLDNLSLMADDIGTAMCSVTISTDTHDPALSHKVAELLPDATIVQFRQEAADTRYSEDATLTSPEETPPDLVESFADYLHANGTDIAPADKVYALLVEFMAAEAELRQPQFPDEAAFEPTTPTTGTRTTLCDL